MVVIILLICGRISRANGSYTLLFDLCALSVDHTIYTGNLQTQSL